METRRIPSLDYIRVVAAFLVVAVHADTITISSTNYLGGISWWLAATINTLGRIAVPLFIMISGALIYENRDKTTGRQLLVRSLKRIVIPGILWITLYFWWMNRWHGEPLTLSYIGTQLWTSNFGYLHFLFIILGLYLVTPVLEKIPPTKRSVVAWIGIVGMVVFEYIRYTGQGWAWTGVTPLLWIGYIPYYLVGSVLMRTRWRGSVVIGLISLSLCSLMIATFSKYWADVGINTGNPRWYMEKGFNYFWGHFSPTDVLLAVTVYYLGVKGLAKGLSLTLDRIVAHVSGATYGIFLSHVMVMDAVEYYFHWQVAEVTSALWLYYIAKTAVIFVLSYVVVVGIRALRLQSLLLGEKY